MPVSVNVQTVHPRKLAAVRREVPPGGWPRSRAKRGHAGQQRGQQGFGGESQETTIAWITRCRVSL